MSSSVLERAVARQPRVPDAPDARYGRRRTDVRIPDGDWVRAVGQALGTAIALAGWSHKEAADHLGVDESELGKWIGGSRGADGRPRRVQVDRVLACPELAEPFVVCLAGLVDRLEVVTQLRSRRLR